jgi:hypothetical protein
MSTFFPLKRLCRIKTINGAENVDLILKEKSEYYPQYAHQRGEKYPPEKANDAVDRAGYVSAIDGIHRQPGFLFAVENPQPPRKQYNAEPAQNPAGGRDYLCPLIHFVSLLRSIIRSVRNDKPLISISFDVFCTGMPISRIF